MVVSPFGLLEMEVEGVFRQAFELGQRWTPSFGQVFVTAKVESGVMIQATLG